MKCQICGSEEKRVLTKLCSNMKIMGPSFPEKNSYVVACKQCGSVYIDIDADQSAFTNYYSSAYSKSLSYFEVFGKDETQIYYDNIEHRIAKYVDKCGRILEIGGGIGELAKYLVDRGYSDVTVMEPSERCIELCKEKGIKTIHSDCLSVPETLEEYYDFIIINHTLEHILEFNTILENAHKMLKQKANMYIEVPDAEKYVNTDFVPYWFFTYEHIVHMCLESFDNLANVFGYSVQEKKSYLKCNSYYVMYCIMQKENFRKPYKYIPKLEEFVKNYIDECEKKLKPVIAKIESEKKPIILWGVGTSTAQLLNGNFDGCDVVKIVDSNPYRQNVEYTVAGRHLKIESPSTIETDDTIIILPLMYDASIRKQIADMKLNNPVQSLIENYRGKQ